MVENVISPIYNPPVVEQTKQVELLVGDQVYNLLDDTSFKAAWYDLYNACTWATAFQSWEFIASWYHVFRSEFVPVLLKSENNGKLNGLLPMAIPASDLANAAPQKSSVRIIGAGEYEAEYHCWLADSETSDQFITAALTKLLQHYPKARVMFRFIPPNAPMAWHDHDAKWRNISVKQNFRRPLLEMKNPLAEKAFRINNQYKTKLNRLKKLGTVKFERVTDNQVFESVLPELALQFDFRQGGLFNKNQFRDKPLKGEFMKELFKNRLLHVTLLKVDEEIIGSMVAVADKGWVHLQGINTHSPFYARHSPGILHFLNLGQLLAHEGVDVFDLTPGGDTYKERLATSHDEVYGLLLTNHTGFRLKRRLKKELQDYLVRTGKRPMTVELQIKKQLYLLKNRLKKAKKAGYVKAVGQLLGSRDKTTAEVIYVKDPVNPLPISQMNIQKNSLNDMLDFEKDTELTRWEFLETTMRLYETGYQSYSWSEDGRLLACAWLGNTDTALPGKTAPNDIPALVHLYCHPDATDQFGQFLDRVSSIVASELDIRQVYAIDQAGNQALQKAGFRLA